MLDRLERIPEVGDHVVVEGVRIEVLAVEDFAIQQLKLCLIDYEEHGDDAIADGKHRTSSTRTARRRPTAAKDPDTIADRRGDDS